ncbi:hypothetical protein THAOC_25063, partial [Thalassiosira oceanica]
GKWRGDERGGPSGGRDWPDVLAERRRRHDTVSGADGVGAIRQISNADMDTKLTINSYLCDGVILGVSVNLYSWRNSWRRLNRTTATLVAHWFEASTHHQAGSSPHTR